MPYACPPAAGVFRGARWQASRKIHEHDGKLPQSLVIRDQNRIVLLYTYESDIGDGIEDPDVHKDPPERREAAMRMATNVLVYALTH